MNRIVNRVMKKFSVLAIVFSLICGSSITAKTVDLKAVGASFPYPFYSKMFSEYQAEKGVSVAYDPMGSGAGVKYLRQNSVDFAASDSFLPDNLIERIFPQKKVIHLPICASAVALAFNIDGVKSLKLSADLISQIFMGEISNWSDPKIAAANPGLSLPSQTIVPIRRKDSSGTTFIFTDFLSKANATWAEQLGRGKRVNWRVGIAAEGNDEMAKMVQEIPGAIAYMGSSYAEKNNITIASIKNQAGNYIYPNLKGISKATDTSAIGEDSRVILTNTDNPQGYPISSLTWLILYEEQSYNNRTSDQALETYNLLRWMVEDGQRFAADLMYAPLTPSLTKKAVKLLNRMTYEGKYLHSNYAGG